MRKYTATMYTDYGVDIQKGTTSRKEPDHDHDFIEIVYIADGKAEQLINNNRYPVKRGDLLFINYGCTHAFVPTDKVTFYNIILKPEFISETLIDSENAFEILSLTAFEELRDNVDTGKELISFEDTEITEIEDIIKGMYRECRDKKPAFKTIIRGYITVLIAKILRNMNYTSPDFHLEEMWQDLVNYINNNIKEKLSLEELAGKCFYNPSYFSRVFKEKFGVTLVEYISKTRATTAARLLDSTTLSVNEISERCGFGNKMSFYRCFSKYYNCTPSEYRDR